MTREVLLTGSVPLRPATKVFETIARHLGDAVPFYPDGEQAGWLMATQGTLRDNPALEVAQDLKLHPESTFSITFYRLKHGMKAKDLKLEGFRTAENAIASYQEFKAIKAAGGIPANTRFLVTIPAAGIVTAALQMLPEESFPIAAAALWEEIRKILAAIPAEELAIQMDLPNETSHEEYRRRPWAFNMRYYDVARLDLEAGVAALGWIANQIPVDVPLGLHTCSAWHLNAHDGQDNRAIVDIANRYIDVIKRPLRYLNMPIHPEHKSVSDYTPLRDLALSTDTVLSLGLINMVDGLEGARHRITMAEKAGIFDFGVSFWCGLGTGHGSFSAHPYVQQPTSETVGDLLDLHRDIAAL